MNMINNQNGPMMDPPEGKQVLGASMVPPNDLERTALSGIDADKINDLAKCLFTLNNRQYGPIPGAYMVVCTKPDKEWCVGQLNADRVKPLILFKVSKSTLYSNSIHSLTKIAFSSVLMR